MPYNVYYPNGCAVTIGDHYCNDCETPEKGRVRSAGFIAPGFNFTDPTNPTEWVNGIRNKQIVVIPKVNGTFDGGSEITGPGYGDQATKLTGFNYSSTYNDPNYRLNADFYNALKRASGYRYFYRTGTQVHITDVAVSVIPKAPVTDDVNSDVTWNVTVNWSDDDAPIPYNAPAVISTCFDYTGTFGA